MNLRDAVADDIRTVLLDPGDWAEPAVLRREGYAPADIMVIFDEAYMAVDAGEVEVGTTSPSAWAATEDVSGATQGDVLVLGGTWYSIIGVEPDGSGMTRLILSRNTAEG